MALLRRKTEAALLVLAALVVMVALISLEISQGNELTGSVFLLIGGFFVVEFADIIPVAL